MNINLHKFVDQIVELEGKISDLPWQHLIDFSDSYPIIHYFDLDSGDQVVIYSQRLIECKKKMKLSGKVIKVVGKSKRLEDKSEKWWQR